MDENFFVNLLPINISCRLRPDCLKNELRAFPKLIIAKLWFTITFWPEVFQPIEPAPCRCLNNEEARDGMIIAQEEKGLKQQ